MNGIGIIAIGRNEGERLRRCLTSLLAKGMPVVYVDSASTDGSPAMARSLGVEVVDLDMSIPFSAARARNEGFGRLMQIQPQLTYVQFVDGDCEVVAGWLETAAGALDERDDVAAVCGRRRERFPNASLYNALADIEWNTPTGQVKSCGGDAMFRVSAFAQSGGFNNSVVAGEEPELCQRLRAANWKILRIDAEMTLHDSAMTRFAQWWKRAVRSGYGSADVAARFGAQGLFVKTVRSARLWAIGWPILVALAFELAFGAAACIGLLKGEGNWWQPALAAAMLSGGMVFLALPLQMLKTAQGIRPRAASWREALAYGALTMIGKWANVVGQQQYRRDRAAGRLARMIDYKATTPPPAAQGSADHGSSGDGSVDQGSAALSAAPQVTHA